MYVDNSIVEDYSTTNPTSKDQLFILVYRVNSYWSFLSITK